MIAVLELINDYYSSRSYAITLQQEEGFHHLAADTQRLVRQLARGHTRLEDLIKEGSTQMRDTLAHEAAKIEQSVNLHTTTQALAFSTAAESRKACDIFLRSLKTSNMNQRYNDVLDSREATFKRIFSSYEPMETTDNESEMSGSSDTARYPTWMSDRDEVHGSWASFTEWLQSDGKLFYIQGKPGSGKSTLIKFILDHERTKELLQRWSSDVMIVHHFIWKIGSHEQNSIKGLLCSLLYQKLRNKRDLIQHTLCRFTHLSSHTEYSDWSIKDLDAVLQYVSNKNVRHLCIFIDGLDEIRNEDGYRKLIQSIEGILNLPNVKLCIATRPEVQIMRWLEVMNPPGILLEDLTRPDMRIFVREKLKPLLSGQCISFSTYEKLTERLVDKAQGVFLWLQIATRSLIEGIENDDSDDLLFARLDQLPADLERLYIDMWRRLNENNSVYRETAARYFRYALQQTTVFTMYYWNNYRCDGSLTDLPTLFQVACAENIETQQTILRSSDRMGLARIRQLCDETKRSILTRCAGLLQIEPQSVQPFTTDDFTSEDVRNTVDPALSRISFIHRTAHDFLRDTEAGRSILGWGSLSETVMHTRLFNGLLCLLVTCNTHWGIITKADSIFDKIIKLSELEGSRGLEVAINMLDIMKPLYDKQLIRSNEYPWDPQVPFLSNLIGYSQFDEFVISSLTREASTRLATDILRNGWIPDQPIGDRVPSTRLVNALLSLGADPHNYGVNHSIHCYETPFARKGTALTNLLLAFLSCRAYCPVQSGSDDDSTKNGWESHNERLCEIIKVGTSMAKVCQDLNATVLLVGGFQQDEMGIPSSVSNLEKPIMGFGNICVLYEVSLQFLLLYLLSGPTSGLAQTILRGPDAQELYSRLQNPSAKIRFILTMETASGLLRERVRTLKCHRIPSRSPDFAPRIAQYYREAGITGIPKKDRVLSNSETDLEIVTKLIKHPDAEEIEYETAVLALIDEQLGFCTLEQAGISPPIRFFESLCDTHRRLFPVTFRRLELCASNVDDSEGSAYESTS